MTRDNQPADEKRRPFGFDGEMLTEREIANLKNPAADKSLKNAVSEKTE